MSSSVEIPRTADPEAPENFKESPSTVRAIESTQTGHDLIKLFQDFVDQEYTQSRAEFWDNITSYVRKKCQQVLEEHEIQAVVSSRVKQKESLLRTLPRLNQRQIRNRAEYDRQQKEAKRPATEKNPYSGPYKTHDDILADTLDISGIRISVYFPDTLPKVRHLLTEQSWVQNLVHKPFLERGYVPAGQDMLPYEERFGHYQAEHFSIRLDRTTPTVPGYQGEPVEIQVRTVLTDAWAEVRHNLVYKVLGGHSHLSRDESRILDSIKGLMASGELLLEHLHNAHQLRLEQDERPFPPDDNFTPKLLETLDIRHRYLIESFGSNIGDMRALYALLAFCGIGNPRALKENLHELSSKKSIDEEVNLIKESLGVELTLADFLICYILEAQPKNVLHIIFEARTSGLPKERNRIWGVEQLLQVLCIALSWLKPRLQKQVILGQESAANWGSIFYLHEWFSLLAATNRCCMSRPSAIHDQLYVQSKFSSAYLAPRPEPPLVAKVMDNFASLTARSEKMPIRIAFACWLAEKAPADDWNLVKPSYEHLTMPELHQTDCRIKLGPHLIQHNEDEFWDQGGLRSARVLEQTTCELKLAVLYRAVCENRRDLVSRLLLDKEIVMQSSLGQNLRSPIPHTCSGMEFYMTVLGVAAVFGDADIMSLVLRKAVTDVNIRDVSGNSAVHIAVLRGKESLVASLLEDTRVDWNMGAVGSPNKGPSNAYKIFNSRRFNHCQHSLQPVDYAITLNHGEIVDLFLRKADLERRSLLSVWKPCFLTLEIIESSNLDALLKRILLPVAAIRVLGILWTWGKRNGTSYAIYCHDYPYTRPPHNDAEERMALLFKDSS